jgi:hypothetical protein
MNLDELAEKIAVAIYGEGAYCGECDYAGWGTCRQCRADLSGYAAAVLAVPEVAAALDADVAAQRERIRHLVKVARAERFGHLAAVGLLEDAEDKMDRLHRDADPTPVPEGTAGSLEQLWHLLLTDDERRLKILSMLWSQADTGNKCWSMDHEGQIENLRSTVKRLHQEVAEASAAEARP